MQGQAESDARRESLLAQLEYLLIEIEALEPILAEIPGAVLTAQPLGEPSVLEALASLARRDREAAAIAGGDEVPQPGSESDDDVACVLTRLHEARTALLARLRGHSAESWEREVQVRADVHMTVCRFVDQIVHQDVETLRSLADRLRSANLFGRAAG